VKLKDEEWKITTRFKSCLHEVHSCKKKSKMASDKELRLKWFFVYDEILSKISTADAFFNAVKIWIERPQVLNRRLVGSYIIQSFLTAKYSDLLAQIFAMTQSGPVLRENLLSLMERYEGKIDEEDKSVVDLIIRSLLPRESSKYCNVLEMIIQGSLGGYL
jgi:hypothetical protein